MSVYISHGLHDCCHLNIVSVIASFDTDGNMRPLYVRIGEESYKIVSSHLKSTQSRLGSFMDVYRCRIMDGEVSRHLELTYHSHEHIWTIVK